MTRGLCLLLVTLLLSACVGPATPSPVLLSTPTAAPASPAPSSDSVGAFGSALQDAGAEVREIGPFSPEPLSGSGTILCVDGQEVRVYAYATEDELAAAVSQINPTDPSQVGTSMVSWAGTPRFWRANRMIVLYLGDSPAIELGLTSVLGEPFARGDGRDSVLNRHSC